MHVGFAVLGFFAPWLASGAVIALFTAVSNAAGELPVPFGMLGNVFVVNSAQIAQGTLNVNETVELANTKAREILPALTAATPAAAGARS